MYRSWTRLSRAPVLVGQTLAILLILVYTRYWWSGLQVHSRPRVPFISHDTVDPIVQLEPQPQIGSDVDPGRCSPSILPFDALGEPQAAIGSNKIIPNIVHFVWLLNGRDEFMAIFKLFVSAYSASLYFQAEKIYFHTDASPEQWEKAKTSANDATRWMLRIPNIVYHWIKPTEYTLNCTKIERLEHLSDFVRTQQLHHYGGIYMDADVIALRDVRKLRESGFSNIMGVEDPGKVNNGFMMSRPGTELLSIYMREQHRVYDKEWLTHSVELLSIIAYRLQAIPGEVLILDSKAFAPSSWEAEAVEELYNPHLETPPSNSNTGEDELPQTPTNAVDYWERRNNREGLAKWQLDYSHSYVIHAFKGIAGSEWPGKVTLEYVLLRQSNFARAAYPAVKHAIDVGIIDRKPATNAVFVAKTEHTS